MVPVNLHQLYYFWVIAKCGSITAATKSLLLSQSTLSKQLKQLETSLGASLLRRARHGVTLTDEGRLAIAYCERMFPHAEELVGLLRSGVAARTPMVRLMVSRTIADDHVLALMRAIKRSGGGVAVKVSSCAPEGLQDGLVRHAADLVLSDTNLSDSMGRDVRARLVASVPHYFVASASLKGPAFPAALGRLPLILRPPEHPLRKDADHFLRVHKITPHILAELDNPDLILAMVLAGEGVGVLDPGSIRNHVRHRRIVRLHHRPVGIRENLWLVCSQQACASGPVQSIVDSMMAKFRLPARG